MTCSGSPAPRLGLPNLGDGVGLREPHFQHLMSTAPAEWGVDWFEVISENFLDHAGYAAHVLEVVAAHRPVVMHGVSLSIGGADPLDPRLSGQAGRPGRPHQTGLDLRSPVLDRGGGDQHHDLLPLPRPRRSWPMWSTASRPCRTAWAVR